MSLLKIPKQSVGTSQMFQALVRNIRVLEQLARRYSLDEVEIAAIFDAIGLDRKFKAEQLLGNTLATYTGWTHVLAQGGYSIWKYGVTGFQDDVDNMLWSQNLDDDIHTLLPQVFEYAGAGDSESAGYFANILFYDGAAFSSNYGGVAGDLSVDGGAYQTVLQDTGDYLYVGAAATFEAITASMKQFGVGLTLKFEYYDSGTGWTALDPTVDSLVDGTAAFTSDGRITFTAPATWDTVEIDSVTQYWIRISTTAAPTQTPSCYAVLPGDSIVTLLRLNSEEIRQEQWRWSYYGGSIYCTFPNMGASAYEGIGWINAASSAANLQNFFIYRNAISTRYRDSAWPSGTDQGAIGGASSFNGTTGVVITHNIGHLNYHVSITSTERPVAAPRADFLKWVTKATDSVTIYCSAGITTDFTYRITVYD